MKLSSRIFENLAKIIFFEIDYFSNFRSKPWKFKFGIILYIRSLGMWVYGGRI